MSVLYSHHIFFFPFKWEKIDLKGESFENRTSIEPFRKALKNDTNWKRLNPFKIDNLSHYNQFNYFHDFVREVLYDMEKSDQETSDLIHSPNNADFLDHYAFKLPEEGQSNYVIQIESEEKSAPLTLEIENIVLQVYKTGVGVISFHLNNRTYSHPDTILKINQYGRRLYPPFFSMPPDTVGTPNYLNNNQFSMQFKATQGIEIAHAISLELGKKKFSDDFSKFSDYENFKNRPFQLPNFISGLFKKGFFNSHSAAFQITPVLDDRMFVMSWFGDNYTAQRLSRKVKGQYAYENDNWWYKYLFVDIGSKSCANDTMSAELLRGATYGRWTDYGTLFGISRYSFVCLTPDLNSLKKNNAEFIVTHIQTIYYKMVELVLLQRACLLRFSNEITHISSMIQKDDPKLTENVSDMLKQYMRFVNKIYFREITAQEQGIELYNMLQKQMDIERHVKDLDVEIQELHNYVMLKEETRRNDRLESLSWIGGIFAVVSLILAVFGTNYFGVENGLKINPHVGGMWFTQNEDNNSVIWLGLFVIGSIFLCLGIWIWFFYKRKRS